MSYIRHPCRSNMLANTANYSCIQRCSPLAADLIIRLLDKNPDTRIVATSAIKHPWIQVSYAYAFMQYTYLQSSDIDNG